jgi:hypothetical protein
VEKSTGFAPYRARDIDIPPRLEGTLAACRRIYDRLYEHRITA